MDSINKTISIGCHVEANLRDRAGNITQLSVEIVPDEEADYASGFLGAGTPLAKIMIGEKAGVVIPYLKDDIYAIEILEVSPSKNRPPRGAKKKRLEDMQKTIREVEHTSAVLFASSFTGKWGDYDPESLPGDEMNGTKGEEDASPK